MKKWGSRPLAIAVAAVLINVLTVPISILASPSPGLGRGQLIEQNVQETTARLIASTNEVLHSPVFVLDNRLVVADLPADRLAPLSSGTAHVDSNGGIGGRFTVLPARLIVVDSEDNILSVSSNTSGEDYSFYGLRIREGHVNGREHPLTQKTLFQYNRLLGEVDWTHTGRVYERN